MALPRLFKSDRSKRSWGVTREALRRWYEAPLGQRLLAEQQEMLDQVLPRCFGQHMLLSGVMADRLLLDGAVLPQQALVSNCFEQIEASRGLLGVSPVRGELSNLPFESDCIDVALLHHCLDYEHNVHAALRELARVVAPGGTMIIIGFNPWSLWGMVRVGRRLINARAPWTCRFMSPFNLSDWLKLLDFEVEGCEYALFLPPLRSDALLNWFSSLQMPFRQTVRAFGASYILVAKKRTTLLTPIKPVWRRPQFIPMPVT